MIDDVKSAKFFLDNVYFWILGIVDDNGVDIYIMMKCLFVTKNHHFLLGVSCNHLNHP